MNIFVQEIWARRKIIIIFLLGILVPTIIVGFLSWNVYSKRREAFRKIFESQLWMSGETAIKSIESALQEYEDSILSPENFAPLSTPRGSRQDFKPSPLLSGAKIFVLDADFQVVYPQAESDDQPFVRWEQSLAGSPIAFLFQKAEDLEFSQKKYAEAAELYHQCSQATPIKQWQAVALERYGSCLASSKKYTEAFLVYQELLDKFGPLKNRQGQPYGLLAALQLYDLAQRQNKKRDLLKTLIDTLDKLRNGAWLLKTSTYDFFAEEIKFILDRELSSEQYPELQKAYRAVRDKPSPYLQELEFKKILAENVAPIIKEKMAFSQYSNEPRKGRFPVVSGESSYLFSYSLLGDAQSDQSFFAGFRWDLDYLKNEKWPEIAKTIAQASGIQVRLIDERGQDDVSHQERVVPENALSLRLRQFPFPWSFIVVQTALEDLKSGALKENIFYGILAVAVIGLMCLGAFLIARDISRESETIRQKSDFVHNISHEIRTPLTLIRLYGETLKDKRNLPEETKREAYEIITGESERLSHLINNVLDFSRIERGKKEFNFQTDNLSGAVKETLESYRYQFKKEGFTIHEELDVGLPAMDFDREAVASVLINLLSNAMKFSPGKNEVCVRLFQKESDAVLQVADQGIGISGKDLDKIFQRFYRSPNKVVSESQGSGLGLTIVKHVAEAHGGKVEVESEPGKGSVFSVILPILKTKEDKT
jgi:signal transduction histidine kinase